MCVPSGTCCSVCGLISRIKFNIENSPRPDTPISAHQRVCLVIHWAFPLVLLHDKVEEPREDPPFLGYVLLRWLLQIIPFITPLSRRTCLDHSIDRYEHQLQWGVTGRAFVFHSFSFFLSLNTQAEATRHGVKIMEWRLRFIPFLWHWALHQGSNVRFSLSSAAGRGQAKLSKLASWWAQVGLYSPTDRVLPGRLFSLHPGNVELYNLGRNLLIRAQAKLILLFILLQCL